MKFSFEIEEVSASVFWKETAKVCMYVCMYVNLYLTREIIS